LLAGFCEVFLSLCEIQILIIHVASETFYNLLAAGNHFNVMQFNVSLK